MALALAMAAHMVWGLAPLYILALAPAKPAEVLAWRTLVSVPLLMVLMSVRGTWTEIRSVLRNPRLLLLTAGAGWIIYVNWLVFTFGTMYGRVTEASLGTFGVPVVMVGLGFLVLREPLRPWQWVGLAISGSGLAVITLGYGNVPWVAIAISLSFGTYSLMKRTMADKVSAEASVTLETVVQVPIALALLALVHLTEGGLVIGTAGPLHAALLLFSSIVMTTPVLLFSAAAQRLNLTTLGLLQYSSPLMHFILGAFLLAEAMPPVRWIGFGLVWLALIVIVIDARNRRSPG